MAEHYADRLRAEQGRRGHKLAQTDSRCTARGVCPRCGRPLRCLAYTPPTSTWSCSCGFVVEMPRASRLYRQARLQFGDAPARDAEARR